MKRLIPLGFSKSDIRKELYASEDLKLLTQQELGVLEGSESSFEEMGERTDGTRDGSDRKKEEEGNKAFSIKSIHVRLASTQQKICCYLFVATTR